MNTLQSIAIFLLCYLSCLQASYDSKTLEEKVFAVHATDYFPESGTVKAGLYTHSNLPDGLLPDFRCTLHFSLGELVRPVKRMMNWEKSSYAVVTPLGDLVEQLINLNCYDSFILGNYTLTERATLIVPQSKMPSGHFIYKIHAYDPSTTSLREAVDFVIASNEGWRFTMKARSNEDKLTKALFNGENSNTPQFFASILNERPHISFGTRFSELDGKAWILGEFETTYMMLLSAYLPLPETSVEALKTENIPEILNTLQEKFSAVEQYILELPLDQKELFHVKKERYEQWLRIIRVDLKLRQKYKKTVAKTELWNKIAKHSASQKELYAYLKTKLDVLAPVQ